MIGLLPAVRDKCIVVLDVGLGTPIGHIVTSARENITPLNVGAIPTTKLVPWLRLGSRRQDRTIGIFPDVINQTQIMTSLDQLTLRVFGQFLQNLVATTCNQILINFVGRHDPIPFLKSFRSVEVGPKRHSIFPIQIVPFVQRHPKRTGLCCTNQKENRHG